MYEPNTQQLISFK